MYQTLVFRTLFFYFFVVFLYRIMGKREVGELGIVDLIVSVLIAEIVAISLENLDESVFLAIIPIAILVICQIVISYVSLKKKKIRDLLDGKPSVIINNGKLRIKEMIKQRYNIDDLLTQLREKNYDSIKDVGYAVLETSGKLSIFEKKLSTSKSFPLPLISEGDVDYECLSLINKDEGWLRDNLDVDIKDIFYGFYANNKLYIIKNADLDNV